MRGMGQVPNICRVRSGPTSEQWRQEPAHDDLARKWWFGAWSQHSERSQEEDGDKDEGCKLLGGGNRPRGGNGPKRVGTGLVGRNRCGG